MFAKQAAFAAVIALAAVGNAFAADAQRNVFDTETHQRIPAAESRLTREQVRAEFLAAHAAGEVNAFDNELTAHAIKPVRAGEPVTRLAKSTTPSAK